ncbi:MAG: polyphosphate polymerase domain-containing protein [Clostridia bacterium]|nr:polyphosphate polymerase domain-containing protein [Clostridia bacterium]
MGFKTVFSRYEYKYIITREQKETLLNAMAPYMKQDQYGKSTIRNLYFDTDSYLLIRRSIEKPVYKEKLRIRSYTTATQDATVFVELKKKFKSVVYKRRLALPYGEAMAWLIQGIPPKEQSQIFREIDYALSLYKTLKPAVFLSYEREAFFGKENPDFRVTFDQDILCRETDLSLASPAGGQRVLSEDRIIMEIKCAGGIPLWMVEILSKEKLYKTSFSKYGTAYRNLIVPSSLKKETVTYA